MLTTCMIVGLKSKRRCKKWQRLLASTRLFSLSTPPSVRRRFLLWCRKFQSLVEANGTVDKVEDWGKRRMAYAIDDLHEGYYTLIQFTSAPSFPAELDRIYKITDGVMRSIIVALD